MLAHCAGMMVLVALPVLIGALIGQYRLDAQQAGGLVTLFLAGAVVSSLFFAPRFNRIGARLATTVGFGVAGLAFAGMALTNEYSLMALLQVLAGIAAGCALSFTHGTVGRSARPHRLFALVNTALGVFGICMMATTPKVVAVAGGAALFWLFACVMLVTAVVSAAAFPVPGQDRPAAAPSPSVKPLGLPVWLGALGVSCLALMHSTVFSFVERMGFDRGFGLEAVTGVLIALGIVNLFPAPLAVLLERRLPARTVVLAGPVVLAAVVLVLTRSSSFVPYAVATCLLPAVGLFVHTFAFGLLARLDPSGRATAATPAMMMAGAALGPILGGTVVKLSGYANLGLVVVAVVPLALFCFALTRPRAEVAELPA
jgi:predicted MFS family arabinose efflux permease